MKFRLIFSLAKLVALWSILCFSVVASAVFADQFDLPENTVAVEAEDGKMDAGVQVVKEDEAGEGKALNHPADARTVHRIDFPSAGKWYLWIRMYTPGPDSTWIGMDPPNEPNPPDPGGGKGALLIYSNVGDSSDPIFEKNPGMKANDGCCNVWFWDTGTVDFHGVVSFFEIPEAGKHDLWIQGREAGTLVDQILLTMDPAFNAEDATGGEPIDIAALYSVSPRDNLAVTWGSIKVSE